MAVTFLELLLDKVSAHLEPMIARVVRWELQQAKLATRQEIRFMALDLSTLTTEVSANTDAVASASALLSQLSAAITAAAGDPQALAALAASLDANNAALSAAVAANTPAAPAAPPA